MSAAAALPELYQWPSLRAVRPEAAQREAHRRVSLVDLRASDHRRPQDLDCQFDRDSLLPPHASMERNRNNNASDSL